jgi:hypothetical protein
VERATSGLDALRNCREAILSRWRALAVGVYPERGARFILGEPDPFRNPVGHVTAESLGDLYDGIVAGASAEEMRAALDGIVRIRAVQELSPSDAVGFVFLLKRAIREEVGNGPGEPAGGLDPTDLFERVDRLALQAFDQFLRCREQVYDLRLKEIRGRVPRRPSPGTVGAAAGSGGATSVLGSARGGAK